ncbi:hypothetical protein [Pedobacter frigiditerrae]|uniref:hypothetical protein n=1 Tax=Pedobacter frigiditerrae TaxID=2530452 RepID=UPI0029303340|nr:hypothetical protein [Pedobacter frigiditerrae]
MSTIIKYTNTNGENITSQQLSNVKDYDKKLYIDGVLKRVETYFDGELNYGTYYLSLDEDKQGIVSEFSTIWRDVEIYFNTLTFGDFTSKDWEVYRDASIVLKGKTIFDNQNREVARQIVDVNSLEVKSTEKTFYLTSYGSFTNEDDIPRFGEFNFYYNADSTEIKVHINLPDYEFGDYIISSNQDIFDDPWISPLFEWIDHPYYHNALPLIPDNSTV